MDGWEIHDRVRCVLGSISITIAFMKPLRPEGGMPSARSMTVRTRAMFGMAYRTDDVTRKQWMLYICTVLLVLLP
ncbi:hypothetical protein BCEN4_1640004 [Burkholderia cenocepacia]|nr:hypothetical protein BCEN4_1640004 [Burkholderia cenocepacia]